ncbi:unnamed protein product [Durusdinium trenchii]|uniref:PDZ domain-containing protein n=1 Tax=Durusdinium trenchii TaxID=1381693 RepID=A0ABP0Q802_9DINO
MTLNCSIGNDPQKDILNCSLRPQHPRFPQGFIFPASAFRRRHRPAPHYAPRRAASPASVLRRQDGRTLAVDAITGGLIQKWNEEHPDKALKPKDRIVEVNGLRGDVLQLVDECKKPKVLKIYVKRESAH